jgi:hypothetical protein
VRGFFRAVADQDSRLDRFQIARAYETPREHSVLEVLPVPIPNHAQHPRNVAGERLRPRGRVCGREREREREREDSGGEAMPDEGVRASAI